MPIETVIDNDYASLVYHNEHKIVHHTFHRPIGGNNFREVLLKGVEVLKEKQANKWLSDDRKNTALSEEDTQFGLKWIELAKEAGWKYWALVVPDNTAGRLNMSKIVGEYAEKGIKTMVFTNPEDALEWLNKLD